MSLARNGQQLFLNLRFAQDAGSSITRLEVLPASPSDDNGNEEGQGAKHAAFRRRESYCRQHRECVESAGGQRTQKPAAVIDQLAYTEG